MLMISKLLTKSILIALGHGIRAPLVSRVLKLGAHVVAQYEALVAEHIGGPDAVRAVLRRRGVDLEQTQNGASVTLKENQNVS